MNNKIWNTLLYILWFLYILYVIIYVYILYTSNGFTSLLYNFDNILKIWIIIVLFIYIWKYLDFIKVKNKKWEEKKENFDEFDDEKIFYQIEEDITNKKIEFTYYWIFINLLFLYYIL